MRFQRVLRAGLGLLAAGVAVGATERGLERYYYGRTLAYYQAADVAYWEDQHTLLLYLPDPTLFWSLKPGIRLQATEDIDPQTLRPERGGPRRLAWDVRVGPKGFRGPDFPLRKPANEWRVACLGDSRTMGEGLQEYETYPARLEHALRQALGGGPRVLNLGHDGWSSYQGVQLLKSRALAYAPDVAVFAFGVNDVDTDWGLSDLERARHLSRPFVAVQRTLYRSMTFYWAQRQFLQAKAWLFGKTRVRGGPRPTDYERVVPRVSPEEYAANLREFVRLCHARGILPVLLAVPPNPYRDWTAWIVTEQPGPAREVAFEPAPLPHVDAAASYARARAQRERGEFAAAHAQFAIGFEATVFAELNRIAARVAREENAVLVDLTPTFFEIAPYAPLYIDEVHANPRGAALIADALAEAILPRVRGATVASAR